jgi:hypothetical protein
MPRYYFHLSAADESFRDAVGFEVRDLSAAHLRAVQLADRVMMIAGLASCAPDLRRWVVQITDARHWSVMTVVFPAEFEKRRAVAQIDGARGLQERLAMRWNPKTFPSSPGPSLPGPSLPGLSPNSESSERSGRQSGGNFLVTGPLHTYRSASGNA